MNQYQEMRDRQQQEFNALPLGFAFGQKQFNEMMRGWGLHPKRDVGHEMVNRRIDLLAEELTVVLAEIVAGRR